jgi:hypothetical protein
MYVKCKSWKKDYIVCWAETTTRTFHKEENSTLVRGHHTETNTVSV